MTHSLLTLDTAKAYVLAYYARLGQAADIEGCGMIDATHNEPEHVRLNVVSAGACASWDVWVECGALYGEH